MVARFVSTTNDLHVAEQDHWSERGRATSVANADALGRPRRSVLSLSTQNYGDFKTETVGTGAAGDFRRCGGRPLLFGHSFIFGGSAKRFKLPEQCRLEWAPQFPLAHGLAFGDRPGRTSPSLSSKRGVPPA